MAVTATLNVSGVAALRYILVDTTTFYFTNAVDGQRLVLTLQQDGTGSRAVASGNCPGIMQPGATANTDTTQVLAYDSATNTWNGVPAALAPGSMVAQSFTTNTAIAWTKGLVLLQSTMTLTITNPVAGPPGVGNDGEVMIFASTGTTGVKIITMTKTQTVNGTSTSVSNAGVSTDGVQLMAFGGNVYVIQAFGATTLT
jgi:hypothetical protein